MTFQSVGAVSLQLIFRTNMRSRTGLDAASQEAFELVQFSVDGDDRPISRASRKSGLAGKSLLIMSALSADGTWIKVSMDRAPCVTAIGSKPAGAQPPAAPNA